MALALPAGIQFRPATPPDLPGLDALLHAGGLPRRSATARGGDVIVAALAGELIGAVALQRLDGDGLLGSACVDAAWRGRGVGAQLVEAALTDAALDALDAVYLVTATAAPWFARFGFLEIPPDAIPFAVARAVARLEGEAAHRGLPMRLRLAVP